MTTELHETPHEMAPGADPFAVAREIADAVCCEGYVLYPYRASSGKNMARWQFGVLAPGSYAEATGSESATLRSDCLVEGRKGARARAVLRFLQVQERVVHETDQTNGSTVPVAFLETPEGIFTSFDEAVEHEIELCDLTLDELASGEERILQIAGGCEVEELNAGAGKLVRTRRPLTAKATVTAQPCEGPYGLTRLVIEVTNITPWDDPKARRDTVIPSSLVATHLLIAANGGKFVSLIDPPEFARAEVAACNNLGTFPVLAGAAGAADLVLSAPVILYDHPEIAPESQANFCDATEIDEMLALRVLTLTEDEKREARATDPRAAALVDLCDDMPPEMLSRLHGAIRSLGPVKSKGASQPAGAGGESDERGELDESAWWDPEADKRFDPFTDSTVIAGERVAKGSKVILRPGRRADAQDLFLAGRRATVSGIFADVDGARHVAVTLDDDPAAELHEWYGRYLYFDPTEIEPLGPGEGSS